ncbi:MULTISPECIES: hypothetical protein [Lactobacillaceae]|nr:hypothetical protein [Lactobacillus sp. HBUAS51381]NLR08362.1 hypothetical protein [Lactobacillus sp. HBUAS51381]
MRHRIGRLIALLFYLVVLLLVIFHQDMLAMYGMAVGMLVEAVIALTAKE